MLLSTQKCIQVFHWSSWNRISHIEVTCKHSESDSTCTETFLSWATWAMGEGTVAAGLDSVSCLPLQPSLVKTFLAETQDEKAPNSQSYPQNKQQVVFTNSLLKYASVVWDQNLNCERQAYSQNHVKFTPWHSSSIDPLRPRTCRVRPALRALLWDGNSAQICSRCFPT